MTRFDEYVERREEERSRARNAEINRVLLERLRTRTKEEVVAKMLGGVDLSDRGFERSDGK